MKTNIFKNTALITIAVFIINNSFALGSHKDSSHVYRINYWVTGIIDIGGTAANLASINRIYDKAPMTNADFLTLNQNAFSKFDQRAFKQNPAKSGMYQTASDFTLGGIILLPLALGFDKTISKDWKDLLLMYYEMHMVAFGFYNYSPMGPTFVNQYRPQVYYNYFTMDQRRTGKNNSAFYSGHVASAVASTFMMVKVYSDYHPAIGWKKYLLYGAATIPPLILSDLRVMALSHFPSDNMVGMGVGMVIGIVVPELHKMKNRSVSLGMFSDDKAAGLSLIWNPDIKNKKKAGL
jgi:hypothetical protein